MTDRTGIYRVLSVMEICVEGIRPFLFACGMIYYKKYLQKEIAMESDKIKAIIQEMIGQETLVRLGDIAQIRKPRRCKGVGKNLGVWEYPIDYGKMKDGVLTDLLLQRNDIIIRGGMVDLVYMVDEDPKEPICHKLMDVVLRPNGKVQPEYIALFLKSETGRQMMMCFTSACGRPALTVRQVRELYIPVPQMSPEEYRKTFEIENHYQLDMAVYNQLITGWQADEKKTIAAVFKSECLEIVFRQRQNAFTRMIQQDVEELKLCFHAKAYKATLIMAGSILEGILIDWLSEKHRRNYFYTDYMVDKEDGKGSAYKVKANLYDYIKAIKEIEAPKWVTEAEMANCIREKRNLVHAKLGIKSSEVNESTCRMVIDYLEKIIATRAESLQNGQGT